MGGVHKVLFQPLGQIKQMSEEPGSINQQIAQELKHHTRALLPCLSESAGRDHL